MVSSVTPSTPLPAAPTAPSPALHLYYIKSKCISSDSTVKTDELLKLLNSKCLEG